MTTRTRNVALGAIAAGLGIAFGTVGRRRRDVTADRAHASRTVTVRCDAGRAYDAWASQEGLRAFVHGVDAARFELVSSTPTRIQWRFARRGRLRGGATVTFSAAPGDRGTEARLSINMSGGRAPAHVAAESLRTFKALMEAGEVPQAVRA
jgi:hypothetical protein